MSGEKPFLCSVCFQPVELNKCKIDEDGRPVHANCYAEMMLFAPKKKPTKKSPIAGTWRRVN